MSPIRLNGSTSGYSQLDAPAIAGDQLFTLPGTGGTLDRLNRAGNVLQVVNATYSIQTSNASTTFVDTGLTATITPTSSSSKILVLINQAGCGKTTNDVNMKLRLMRGVTTIVTIEDVAANTSSTVSNYIGACSTCYLDSPATVSATTYKTQFACISNAMQVLTQVSSATSTITLMEIAA